MGWLRAKWEWRKKGNEAGKGSAACDFTRKCSQLFSHMGYLRTRFMKSLYLGAMVRVEKWVIRLMAPLSLIGQVLARGHELPTLLSCTMQVFQQLMEKAQPPQLHSGKWLGTAVCTYQLGTSRSVVIMVIVGLYNPPKLCESKLGLLRPRTKASSWGLESRSQRSLLGSA